MKPIKSVRSEKEPLQLPLKELEKNFLLLLRGIELMSEEIESADKDALLKAAERLSLAVKSSFEKARSHPQQLQAHQDKISENLTKLRTVLSTLKDIAPTEEVPSFLEPTSKVFKAHVFKSDTINEKVRTS